MKLLIHDLDQKFDELFRNKFERIISADGKYAPCQGCFGCWTKHPAECFMKDSLHEACRMLGTADELFIITENCYGSYSPSVKNVLDRSIGLSTPFSTYRGKQMHHTLRYGQHEKISVFVYGDISDKERKTFELMVYRNSLNFGYKNHSVEFSETPDRLEEML